MTKRSKYSSYLPIAVAAALIVATAILFSYCPQITWNHAHPQGFASSYGDLSLAKRLAEVFNKWDVLRYTAIAVHGYPAEERAALAFFPGWPWFLRALGKVVGEDEARLGMLAIPINILLWALSLQIWLKVCDQTPCLAESPRWLDRDRRSFAWFYALYPTTLFCVVGYLESAFLLVSGCAVLAALQDSAIALLFLLPLLTVLKHIGILAGAAILAWFYLIRRSRSPLPLLGYIVGLGFILFYYAHFWGDALAWAKAQAGWGRHLAWPHEVILDTRGRGAELILYALFLYLGPALLLFRALKTGIRRPANLLPLFFCGGILAPIWFGGSIQSIYRIIYLVPFLLAATVCALSVESRRGRMTACTLLVLMNLHATYRYVQNLFIN